MLPWPARHCPTILVFWGYLNKYHRLGGSDKGKQDTPPTLGLEISSAKCLNSVFTNFAFHKTMEHNLAKFSASSSQGSALLQFPMICSSFWLRSHQKHINIRISSNILLMMEYIFSKTKAAFSIALFPFYTHLN